MDGRMFRRMVSDRGPVSGGANALEADAEAHGTKLSTVVETTLSMDTTQATTVKGAMDSGAAGSATSPSKKVEESTK